MSETTARDYRSTLNLPKTEFPMRGELPKREPDRVRWWAERKTYLRRLERNRAEGGKPFVLHDGPPYANGDLHMGTFLNRVLKDVLVKIHLLAGEHSDFVPGWDMHGLPIERETLKHLKLDFRRADPIELRRACRERALYWMDRQREQIKRMGTFGRFDDPYMTIAPSFEATIVETLADLAEAEYLYKGLRSTLWCVVDETALAEAEIEYKDHTSPSIYVRFRATGEQRRAILEKFGLADDGTPLSVAIWTTTPWTLPANVAIALKPDATYGVYRAGDEDVVLVESLAQPVLERLGKGAATLRGEAPGSALERLAVRHPFLDRDSMIVNADYVELETGTGAVHTAPGHGADDFETGARYGLPVITPVDAAGRFTVEAGPYAGLPIFEANPRIVEDLRASGALIAAESYDHSYPHCWRCKNPVIFRATAQWFIGMDRHALRQRAEAAAHTAAWLPAWGENRMSQMVGNHPEWCVSRQRVWGTPIPAVVCTSCNESVLDPQLARNFARAMRGRPFDQGNASDLWWTEPLEAFAPPGLSCANCGGTSFEKERNIVDIWFESGVTWRAVLVERGMKFPASAYLEGSDQYRGWFRSNLVTSVAVRDVAPYEQVISHGWVVDQHGHAMHKSAGNYIAADEAIEKYGCDVLRLWVASTEFTGDSRLGAKLLDNVSNVYKNLRFRLRYFLGSLDGLTPDATVPRERMEPIDRLALVALDAFAARVVDAYRRFDLHDAYVAIQQFDKEDVSAFYVDALKDRLYSSAPGSPRRRSAQSALLEMFRTIAVLLAPILSFTAEEAWQYLPADLRGEHESIFDVPFPPVQAADEEALAVWSLLKQLRAQVAASEGVRDFQLDATVEVPRGLYDRLAALGDGLREALVVSSLRRVDASANGAASVVVVPADGEKCQRCWKYLPLGTDPEHPTVCASCAQIVRDLEARA